MIFFKKKVLQAGLDIGNSSIRLIQLSGDLNDLTLTGFSVMNLEKGNESKIAALEELAKKLPSKEVNISISGPSVVVRYIELPRMTESEIKSSMKFEAGKYVPFDIKDIVVDCKIVERTSQGKIKVLLVAAKKDIITERLKLVESAGLSVNVIDCDSFALMNAYLLNFPDIEEGSSTVLLDLGERLISVNILKGKEPALTRELQMGSFDLSKAISEKLNLDMKSARKLTEQPEGRFQEILEIVKPEIARMVEEVKLSLSYYENQFGIAANKICLSGGLSSFKGLVDIFNESLGIDCRLWDPFSRIKIEKEIPRDNLDKEKNKLPVALGLALRR